MSLSREAKIGILVTVSLIIFFFGFYFLKGSSIFADNKEYYCFYGDAQNLQNSAAVQIRGLTIGRVSGTKLVEGKGVLVTISVGKNVDIPKGTIAALTSLDFITGTKMIRLDLGNGALTKPGDTLSTTEEPGIIDNISDQMTPLIRSLRQTVSSLDTAIAGINVIAGAENRQVISDAIKAVKITADNLSAISANLNHENTEISGIVHNTNTFTATLANSSDTLHHLINNLNSVSNQVANAPIQKTLAELETTTAQLRDVMTKVNNNQGSMGLLVNDKNLYNNLTSSLSSLDKLLADLKAHPKRYINVSIFGGKKKKGADSGQ